jgi:AbrB family looped-hinge helix DNA binding protein
MIEVVTMSSKGQFVVPRDIREEMRLQKTDRFVIVHDHDSILLKKIHKEEATRKMAKLLDKMAGKFREAGISEDDVKGAVRRARA